MALITLDTVVTVPEDRTLTLQLPPEATPGRHQIVLIIEQPDPEPKPFNFPVMPDAKWPDDLSLRREDTYGDDGR